ncbi:hypothetical protein [Gluconobacter kondonii]|uniref:hypothetical protein n=1 Tax=Gluconobacter kondonii TaxID=941463 RepID=UPI0011AEE62D|nr:hypothetical protein [Gluconobacter kondonii]
MIYSSLPVPQVQSQIINDLARNGIIRIHNATIAKCSHFLSKLTVGLNRGRDSDTLAVDEIMHLVGNNRSRRNNSAPATPSAELDRNADMFNADRICVGSVFPATRVGWFDLRSGGILPSESLFLGCRQPVAKRREYHNRRGNNPRDPQNNYRSDSVFGDFDKIYASEVGDKTRKGDHANNKLHINFSLMMGPIGKSIMAFFRPDVFGPEQNREQAA